MGPFPKDEIKRKAFHLLSLLFIGAYWWLPLPVVLWCMGILIVIVGAGEIARLKVPGFDGWILGLLGGVHRGHEVGAVSGLPWTLSGSFLTMLLIPDRNIVMAALLYMALGDAAAALFGKAYGRTRLPGGKTLEGSVACCIVCFLVGWYFLGAPLAIVGALIATLVEFVPWPLNDNLFMPLISAGALMALLRFLA